MIRIFGGIINVKREISSIIKFLEPIRDGDEFKELECHGTAKIRGQKVYLYEREKKEGKRVYSSEKLLGTMDSIEVRTYVARRYVKVLVKELIHNLGVFKRALRSLHPCDYESIMKKLPPWMGNVPMTMEDVYSVLNGGTAVDRVKDDEGLVITQSRLVSEKEMKRHISVTGVPMFSKNEVIIDAELTYAGIKHIYEPRMDLIQADGTRVTRYADFGCYGVDGLVYWEHIGKITDDENMNRNANKLRDAFLNGFYPCKNIIYTYDDAEGGVDASEVRRWIELKFKNKRKL